MTARFAKSEALLEKFARSVNMTQAGKEWLIAAIDPFHDTPIDGLKGYIDMTEGASIVQVIKQNVTIVAPTTNNWDCLIRCDPTVTNGTGWNGTVNGNIFTQSSPHTSAVKQGGVSVMTGEVGNNLSILAYPYVNATGTPVATLTVPPGNVKGRFRVIACAFEVHNTTSELYKQGAVTVFEQFQGQTPYSETRLTVTNVLSAWPTAYPVQIPPISSAKALLLSGSKTWEAAAGAYVVATMNSFVNIPVLATPADIMSISGNWDLSYPNNSGTNLGWAQDFVQTAGAYSAPQLNMITPYNSKGMYFTGLSPQSTLVLNVNYIVERFPEETESDLVLLATPSPCYDPVAMEAYAHLMRFRPVGVPVSENGFGDWFMGGVAELVNMLTGTSFATRGLKYLNSNASKPERRPMSNKTTQTWERPEREVKVVRKEVKQGKKQGPQVLTLANRKQAATHYRKTGMAVNYRNPEGKLIRFNPAKR